MLVIRLTRVGKKNQPTFRVALTEKKNPVKGKFIEILGYYNPRLKTKEFCQERILYWLALGAKCSATVHNLLVSAGIIKGAKIAVWQPKKKTSEVQSAGEQPEKVKSAASAEVAPKETPAEKPAEAPVSVPAAEVPAEEPKPEEKVT